MGLLYHYLYLFIYGNWVSTPLHKNRRQLCTTGMSGLQAIACSPDTTPAYPHLTLNIQQTKNETTNVVINIIVASS